MYISLYRSSLCRSRLYLWRVDLHKLDLSLTRSMYILTDGTFTGYRKYKIDTFSFTDTENTKLIALALISCNQLNPRPTPSYETAL